MKNYRVEVLAFAYEDLFAAKQFYERQADNLGKYFLNSLLTDIESLSFFAGIHQKKYGFYRMLAKRFPYAVYYDIEDNTAIVYAVLDLRSNPLTHYNQLNNRS